MAHQSQHSYYSFKREGEGEKESDVRKRNEFHSSIHHDIYSPDVSDATIEIEVEDNREQKG